MIFASSVASCSSKSLPRKFLIADHDQHLSGLALTTSDHLHANQLLVDLWGSQRERPWGAIQRE